jgi:hypothetical protein
MPTGNIDEELIILKSILKSRGKIAEKDLDKQKC